MSNQIIKQLIKQLSEIVTVDIIVHHVTEIIEEIKTGKWPGNTPLFSTQDGPATVEQVMSIKDWHVNEQVIHSIASTFSGRMIRTLLDRNGIDITTLSMQQVVDITSSTDANENEAVKLIILKQR